MARFAWIRASCAGLAFLGFNSFTQAQQANNSPGNGPGAALNDALRRSTPPQGPLPLSEEWDPTGGPPYRTPDGRYVTPDPNSPDGWSPAQRLYPDYSRFRSNDSFRQRALGQRDEMRPDPQYQGYYAYPYGGCVGGDALGDAYSQGRYDARHDYLWHLAQQRAGRILNQYAQMFDEGLEAFYEGRYDRAAINLIGAADKNQASAGARLHAGHALFALGRYDDAMVHIARAFELNPGLAHKTYDIREEYGDIGHFEAHFSNLQRFVANNPGSEAGLCLLGYVTFFTGNPGGAYQPLARAARLNPRSYFIPKLLELARVTQSAAVPRMPPPPQAMRSVEPALQPAARAPITSRDPSQAPAATIDRPRFAPANPSSPPKPENDTPATRVKRV